MARTFKFSDSFSPEEEPVQATNEPGLRGRRGLGGAEDPMKPRDELEGREELGLDRRSMADSIINEMVKAYGFRSDPKTGKWSWSLGNIGKAFAEDPIWSTLDYALLLAGPAKFAATAGRVATGARAVGKAYKAGRFADRTAGGAKTLKGKFAEQTGLMSPGLTQAAELASKAPPKTRVGRFFSSPSTQEFDAEYMKLVDEFGADPGEIRGLYDTMDRERRAYEGWAARFGEDITRQTARFAEEAEPSQMEALTNALRSGISPDNEALAATLGMTGAKLYKNQVWFRNTVHVESYLTGLIPEETFLRHLSDHNPALYEEVVRAVREEGPEGVRRLVAEKGVENLPVTYTPRLYEEYTKIADEAGSVAGKAKRPSKGPPKPSKGTDRFKRRSEQPVEGLTEILDPAVGMLEIAKAADVVAKQKFAQALGRSVISKRPSEVVDMLRGVARSGDPKLMKMHGLDPDLADELVALGDEALEGVIPEERLKDIARRAGWTSLDDAYKGREMPAYLKNLPEELKGKLLDPLVRSDVEGMSKIAEDLGIAGKVWAGTMGFFRASKTAYNPATWMRNYFGGIVFHHLATGGMATAKTGFHPVKGIKALAAGPDSEDYVDALKAGLIDSTFSIEIHKDLMNAYGHDKWLKSGGEVSAVDFLKEIPIFGGSKVVEKVSSSAAAAERGYRAIDEWFKMDAFVRLKEKFIKNGLSREEAVNKALIQTNKFYPTFSTQSDFTKKIRGVIPFASFQTESLRIWKNALQEKPHLVYFWNHMVDAAGKAGGALAGFDIEEIEAAEESMPYYTKGKKMAFWPMRVGGKPVFLDMSYLIPMANINEAVQGEADFFENALIDPTVNPFLSVAIGAKMGKDPFTKRSLEPNFTEKHLGIPVEGEKARSTVGLIEHMAKVMLPPLAPPGYAATNILELAKGEKHSVTGEKLEEGAMRTLAANVLGIRLYDSDVNSQLLNVRHENRKKQARISDWWNRWETAAANGNIPDMEKARSNVIELRSQLTGEDGAEWFEKWKYRHEPGEFHNVSTRQMKETIERAEDIGRLDEADKRMLAVLWERLRQRNKADDVDATPPSEMSK